MKYSQEVLRGNDLYLSNLERSAKLISKKAEAFKMVLIDRQMPFRDARTSNDIENDKIGRVKEFNFVSSIIFKRNFGQIGQLEKILNDNNLMLYFLKHSPKVIKEARTMLQPNFQDVYQITKKLYNADNNALNTLYLREQTKNYRDYIIYLMKQIIELLKQNRGQSIDDESVDSKIIEMEDFINRLQYSENPESFIQTNTGMNVNDFMSELIEQMSDYDDDEETNNLVNQISELLGDDYEDEELNGDEEINDNQQNIYIEPEENAQIEQYEWEETKEDARTNDEEDQPVNEQPLQPPPPPPRVNEQPLQPPPPPPRVNQQPPPPPPRVNQQPPPPPPRVNQQPPPPPPRRIIDEEDDYLREQLERDQQEMSNIRNDNRPPGQDIMSQIKNQRGQLRPVDNSDKIAHQKPLNLQQSMMAQIKNGDIKLNHIEMKPQLAPQLEPTKKNELANQMAEQFDNFAKKMSNTTVQERNKDNFVASNDDEWDEPVVQIKPVIQQNTNLKKAVTKPPETSKAPPKIVKQEQKQDGKVEQENKEQEKKPPAEEKKINPRDALAQRRTVILGDDDDDEEDDDNEWMGAGGFGRKKINSLTYQELRSILSVLGLPNSRGLKKPQLLKILKGYKNKNKK
jgi:hypothetical protein